MTLLSLPRVRAFVRVALTGMRHFAVSILVLLAALVTFGLAIGAEAHLFEDRLAYQLDGEVHVFFEGDSAVAHVVRGDNDRGFRVDTAALPSDGAASVRVEWPADGSEFDVPVIQEVMTPAAVYDDKEPIVAISDLESGFGALRTFLVAHGVADERLNWTFGKGHLVVVGDLVDRGASTTQVLWGVYKLEQSARQAGGTVHVIIGNHEIKNLQGNYQTANEKYFHIAGILGKQQHQLFDDSSILGRWLASKNVVEVIDGVAFVHGGLHPDLGKYRLSVEEINRVVRAGYRTPYYTPVTATGESFLRSSTTGPAWYRGYLKDDLSPQAVERGLSAVGARAVVVGHTLQGKVNVRHGGRVVAIDVRHPKDYLRSFPLRSSEGLLIKDGEFNRLLEGGGKRPLRVSVQRD
ncbi:MAG: metallophosphoesterase [Gemmatimonadaceae bacterium]|nr:metallophosphoesterase [Gemmatimonadaceae bacterium]